MSPSPESQSRKDARQLVEGIAKKHGYLGEDVLSGMSDDVRRKVVDAMDRKDNMMGYSFKTYVILAPSVSLVSDETMPPKAIQKPVQQQREICIRATAKRGRQQILYCRRAVR